jgi:hypothetical protein
VIDAAAASGESIAADIGGWGIGVLWPSIRCWAFDRSTADSSRLSPPDEGAKILLTDARTAAESSPNMHLLFSSLTCFTGYCFRSWTQVALPTSRRPEPAAVATERVMARYALTIIPNGTGQVFGSAPLLNQSASPNSWRPSRSHARQYKKLTMPKITRDY